jgi:predicted AlkP superfamily pyrophosphatase or phosphodiesterase
MVRFFIFIILSGITISVEAQKNLSRPKLVVGVVVDQMRWDYLYRYYDRYEEKGGFKRLMNDGFLCENTLIPFTATYTACGHSCIYTGSVPAISGITGNNWWDREQMRSVYCTEDNNVQTVGSSSTQGKMSPRNMFVTTVCDELRIATNFQSKIIGISIKDRGGILPAGHSANAAYWYDNSVGNWITSTYYMDKLPQWVSDFNAKKMVDGYYREGWKLLYPAASYIQSTADNKSYEAKLFGNSFPYNLTSFIGKDYGKISTSPMGNSLTAEFAKAAVIAEQLGADKITDLLAISFSSPDYIGHSFGPNSIESEDGFLRLDKELGSLFDFLDTRVGKGQYTVFLSADHGVAQIPEFMKENKMPAGRIFMNEWTKYLNQQLNERFHIPNIILNDDNSQLALNHRALDSTGLDKKEIIQQIITQLSRDSAIAMVFPIEELNTVPLPATLRIKMNNGYYKPRNGDIQIILKPNYFEAWNNTGTTHGSWYLYDSHIPLIWYGWGIKKGKTYRETYMTDIAPTIAALLNIQAPNGSVGNVIQEVLGNGQ